MVGRWHGKIFEGGVVKKFRVEDPPPTHHHQNIMSLGQFKHLCVTFLRLNICACLPNESPVRSFTLSSGRARISPRWGRQLSSDMILPKFPKNCMKLKEFGPLGGFPCPPLDPPLLPDISCVSNSINKA